MIAFRRHNQKRRYGTVELQQYLVCVANAERFHQKTVIKADFYRVPLNFRIYLVRSSAKGSCAGNPNLIVVEYAPQRAFNFIGNNK